MNTRSTELLRSPEETPEAILPETLEAGEERLEASLELENRQVEVMKTFDWSEEREKEEDCGGEEMVRETNLQETTDYGRKSEEIGMGELVSISRKQRGKTLVKGTVSVTKTKIEIKSNTGEFLWNKNIFGEEYRKENVKIMGFPLFPGVCWTDEQGKDNGLIFTHTIDLRDKLLDCIIQMQDGDEEDMGFGLFD